MQPWLINKQRVGSGFASLPSSPPADVAPPAPGASLAETQHLPPCHIWDSTLAYPVPLRGTMGGETVPGRQCPGLAGNRDRDPKLCSPASLRARPSWAGGGTSLGGKTGGHGTQLGLSGHTSHRTSPSSPYIRQAEQRQVTIPITHALAFLPL